MEKAPLHIFVAMPGTDMGPNASYQDPKAVKENLLDDVVDRLRSALGCEVDLVIEKDKTRTGDIYDSMFAEARDAEVYIADLTGANPNVYLELGVRWALRDHTTVVISQSVADLKFNVLVNRAIIYGPNNLRKAASDITEAIKSGLSKKYSDSPVRARSEYIEISKAERDALYARIKQLESERGDDLFKLAIQTNNLGKRIEMLRSVVKVNPAFTEAFIELGTALRAADNYAEAFDYLREAVRIEPGNAKGHRELGVTYNKAGQPERAAESLRTAIGLDPQDYDAWSVLGGALRRIGMADAEQGSYDRIALSEARDSYAKARELKKSDLARLYPALNVARIDILLSKWEAGRLAQGQEEFRKEINLCRQAIEDEMEDEPDYLYNRFNLGDALLFSGPDPEARRVYQEAIDTVPRDRRADTLRSVLGPMHDMIRAQVLSGDLLAELEQVITMLEGAMREAEAG